MKLIHFLSAALSVSLAVVGSVQAASTTWNNTGNNFNTAGNWTGGLPGPADNAVFSGGANVQPVISSSISINALSFIGSNASGYLLSASGGSLTLNSVGATTSSAIYSANTSGLNTISTNIILGAAGGSTMSFTQEPGGTLILSGNISSANAIAGLSLAGMAGGVGKFTLSGSNSYAGNTSLDGNGFRTSVNINNAYALSSGKLIGGAAVEIDNTSGAAIVLANNNAIDLGGTLRFVGTNDLSFGSGVMTVTASSEGLMTVQGGTLTVGSLDADTTAKSFRKNGAGTLVISGSAGSNFQGGTTLAAGTLAIGHKNALGTGNLSVSAGTLTAVANLGGNNAIGNNIVLSGNLNIAGSNNLGISGAISQVSGARVVDVSNTGTTTFSGINNSYLGATRLSASGVVLEVTKLANGGANSSIGASSNAAANLVINDGATLRYVGAGDSTDRLFQISGLAGTVVTLDSSGGGAIQFTNAASLSHSSSNLTRTLNLTGTNKGNNSVAYTLANNGSGQLSVTKNGIGSWTLAGASSYTGATTINAGTLVVSGGISNSSAVTVNGGGEFRYNSATARTGSISLNGAGNASRAVLSGTGAINTAITLNDLGDTLSPGNSPGVQIFGVSQSWDSFTYLWETNNFTGLAAGLDFDQISIQGSLALNGSGAFQLDLHSLTAANLAGNVPNFIETDRSWVILTTTSGITGFDADNWDILDTSFTSIPTWQGSWSLDQVGGDLVLSYTAVPEPSAVSFMVVGLATTFLVGRRRR